MNNNKKLLKELTSKDRKYNSLVDEYRRIYQVGKVISTDTKDLASRNSLFKLGIEYMLRELKVKEDLENLFVGKKFKIPNSFYKKIEIIWIKNTNNEKVIEIKVLDGKNNTIIKSFSILSPYFWNQNNRIQYYEKYKFDSSLYGLSDAYKKILVKKRCYYRAAILTDNICKRFGIKVPEWSIQIIKKAKKKGFISVN